MKKFLTTILCCLFFILPFSACSDTGKEYHTVTFYVATLQGNTKYYRKQSSINVLDGDVIGNQAPSFSFRSYVWYTSKSGNIEWNLYSDEVKSDMDLYGRW